ncbi:hypothetical protein CBR_g46752 [Chara braunii]|uniref:Mediator of RNA polymerase II transcription subunit 7 n=1 Tax=Chara braunii TaxID=69332 RepID=A0A388K451_CHABU|nr:hypothetical protein CBR_g46752 [Chara braunii]|eukprot:GBG64796.1 hypothetical protein CBR_g46752 [Chara braunii]
MAASAYPPPPPFYRLYKHFKSDEEEGEEDGRSDEDADKTKGPDSAGEIGGEDWDLPPQPPPPITGAYVMYGQTYGTEDVLPTLEEQGLRQLYPKGVNVDFKKELKALNRELLFNFLELADVLVDRPSQYARRIEDIGLIFRNIHHLLNGLRPHQARTTLIHILEVQLKRRKEALAEIRRRREEAKALLRGADPSSKEEDEKPKESKDGDPLDIKGDLMELDQGLEGAFDLPKLM